MNCLKNLSHHFCLEKEMLLAGVVFFLIVCDRLIHFFVPLSFIGALRLRPPPDWLRICLAHCWAISLTASTLRPFIACLTFFPAKIS